MLAALSQVSPKALELGRIVTSQPQNYEAWPHCHKSAPKLYRAYPRGGPRLVYQPRIFKNMLDQKYNSFFSYTSIAV